MFSWLKQKQRNSQKGSSIVMMACSLAALMFTGGVVVDLGNYYSQISRLQNAADSAAAAGASVYVNKGTTRLIPVSNEIDDEGTFTYNIDGQDYTFKLTDTKKDDADELAEYYVAKNDESTAKGNMETRLWEDKTTSTLANGTTTSYIDAYAYRVDLSRPVELYFSRLFGLNDYEAKASAMAIFVIEPDEENIKEFVEEISANIYNTIPNYYWDSINYSDVNINTYRVNDGYENYDNDIIQRDGLYSYVGTKKSYGSKNSIYFTADHATYIQQGFVDVEPLNDNRYIAFAYTNQPINKKWCADPIKGTDGIGLTKMVYNINKKMIMETAKDSSGNYTEITGLFLDRLNIESSARIGSRDVHGVNIRALELNISDEEISKNNNTPLYMRFECEPRSDNTLVQPIIINVNGKQKKPLVIAYDGPDALRTKYSVPWVDTKTGMAYAYKWYTDDRGTHYYFGWNNPLNWNGDFRIANKRDLTPTSTITPAPYTVNLKEDFNGVIYAPFSRITITGNGKIIGFILAKEIVDNTNKPPTRKAITVDNVTLPTWGMIGMENNQHYYLVKNITSSYSVVYDEFYNYTKIAPNL